MSLVASTRQTPSILPRLVLVDFANCNFDILALCKKMEVVTIFDFLPHYGDVDDISNVVVWRSAFDGEHH